MTENDNIQPTDSDAPVGEDPSAEKRAEAAAIAAEIQRQQQTNRAATDSGQVDMALLVAAELHRLQQHAAAQPAVAAPGADTSPRRSWVPAEERGASKSQDFDRMIRDRDSRQRRRYNWITGSVAAAIILVVVLAFSGVFDSAAYKKGQQYGDEYARQGAARYNSSQYDHLCSILALNSGEPPVGSFVDGCVDALQDAG